MIFADADRCADSPDPVGSGARSQGEMKFECGVGSLAPAKPSRSAGRFSRRGFGLSKSADFLPLHFKKGGTKP